MSGRDAFAERAVAFETRRQDPEVSREAVAQLRAAVFRLDKIAHQGQQLADAFPGLNVRSVAFSSIRAQLGLIWHELELAEAAL